MKKEFNWEEFKNNKIAVVCKNYEEIRDFINKSKENNIRHTISVSSYIDKATSDNKEILFDYFDCKKIDCEHRDWYNSNNYKVLQWTDYMDNKQELNYIEVYQYPLESIFKSGDDIVKLTNNGFGQKILKVQIQENCYEAIEPNENWANSKFTLVSLPSKQVTFKEAIEEFSKGGNIQSELNGNKKIYVGLKANGKQKETLTTYEGFNLTIDEILNAKWYILDKIERY